MDSVQVGVAATRAAGAQAGEAEHRAAAGAVVAPGDRAVLDPHIGDADAGRRPRPACRRGGGCGDGRAGSGVNCQFGRPCASVSSMMSGFTSTSRSISTRWLSSGSRASFSVQPLERGHLRAREAGRVGKADALHDQRRLQRQPQPDAALQRQVAAGRLLHRRDDARLQAVRIEAERRRPRRRRRRARPDPPATTGRCAPGAGVLRRAIACLPPCSAPLRRACRRARENPACGTSPSCGAAGPPPPAMFRRRDGAGEARGRAGEARSKGPRPWRRRRCSGRAGRISRRPGSARRSPRSGREAGGCARSAATAPARPASARHGRACGSR